jgi:hypothetical protein
MVRAALLLSRGVISSNGYISTIRLIAKCHPIQASIIIVNGIQKIKGVRIREARGRVEARLHLSFISLRDGTEINDISMVALSRYCLDGSDFYLVLLSSLLEGMLNLERYHI